MKKKTWAVLCAIALTGCLISGGYILHYRQNQKHAEELYEEAKKTAEQSDKTEKTEKIEKIEKETTPTPVEATETPVPTPTEVPVDIPIDFASLQKENEDIYAWIKIDGTNMDYPVVQSSTDDTFYIHRGIDKEDLYAGAIYTEMQNAKDFSDPNTVLYGHNMKDGSMFATLHNFRDRDFFDQHREILIYTPKHILHYTIFAAYTYDDRHILNSFDFSDKKVFQNYLDEIYNIRSMDAYILDEPKVTAEDKIITLSTCMGSNASARYLVQGVLTETE